MTAPLTHEPAGYQYPFCTLATDYETALLEVTGIESRTLTQAVNSVDRETVAHAQVVDLLLRIARTERSVLAIEPVTGSVHESDRAKPTSPQFLVDLENLRADLRGLLSDMPELRDKRLLPDLFDRHEPTRSLPVASAWYERRSSVPARVAVRRRR